MLVSGRVVYPIICNVLAPFRGGWEWDFKRTINSTTQVENRRTCEVPWVSRWWFQTFFMFTPIWGNDPI